MNRSPCDEVLMFFPDGTNPPQNLPAALAAHVEHCPDCRELLQTKSAVSRLMMNTKMDPLSARRLEVRILSRFREGDPTPRRTVRTFAPAAAVFAAILALSVGAVFLISKNSPQPVETVVATAPPVAQAPRTADPINAVETEDRDKTLTLSHGAAVWVAAETTLAVLTDTEKLARIRVSSGRVIVDIAEHPPGFRFVVETPSAEVEALGTVFSVAVSPLGEETVRVVESTVRVRPKNGTEPALVRAGEQLQLGISPPVPATEAVLDADLRTVRGEILSETPQVSDRPEGDDTRPVLSRAERRPGLDDVAAAIESGRLSEAERLLRRGADGASAERLKLLFKLAAAYRTRGNYSRTTAVYEHLVRTFPEEKAAINTLVSIAQIKQGFLKDPAGALFYYDRYLKKRPRGVLAEAASVGKLRALFTLGQWEEVITLSERYLNTYPSGISRVEVVQKREHAQKMLTQTL